MGLLALKYMTTICDIFKIKTNQHSLISLQNKNISKNKTIIKTLISDQTHYYINLIQTISQESSNK